MNIQYDKVKWDDLPIGPENVICTVLLSTPRRRWWHRFWRPRGHVTVFVRRLGERGYEWVTATRGNHASH